METEDLDLFERSLGHATALHTGHALDAALEEMGWHDALAVDRRTAISVLFGLQGATNASSSALGWVLVHALGVESGRDAGMVLPAIGRSDPPGTIVGDDLVVKGIGPSSLRGRTSVLVVALTGDLTVVVTVPSGSLSFRSVEGMDPDLQLVEVSATIASSDQASARLTADWSSAVALGRLAVAHEVLGASRAMLDLAREHAMNRIQFGRPISSFQAIRHRLAETLVGIEMADALVDAAWLDGAPTTVAMAKAVAGRQGRAAARHCQQVLAGVGFTTEHPLHRSIRRVLVLDAFFGSATTLTRELGSEVIDSTRLPTLAPL